MNDSLLPTTQLSTSDIKNFDRDLQISDLRLEGKSLREIGRIIGLSFKQVKNILDKSHIKEIQQQVIAALILQAPKVGKRLMEHVNDTEDKTVSMKAIVEYDKVTGISQPHASFAIQNLYIDASQTNISAQMMQLLSPGMDSLTEEDIIDVVTS